jgi:hypothetical protein
MQHPDGTYTFQQNYTARVTPDFVKQQMSSQYAFLPTPMSPSGSPLTVLPVTTPQVRDQQSMAVCYPDPAYRCKCCALVAKCGNFEQLCTYSQSMKSHKINYLKLGACYRN